MKRSIIARLALVSMFGWVGGTTAHATVITPEQSITTTTSGWNTTFDSGSNGTLSLATDPQKGKVLELTYNLGTGTYVNIAGPNFSTTKNLLALGNALRFELKGQGLQNSIKMELKDASGHVYQSVTRSSRTSGWETITMRFELQPADDVKLTPTNEFTWAYGGNTTTSFTYDQVSEAGFTLVPDAGGAGSVVIDQLRVVSLANTYTAELLIDDCSNITTNSLGRRINNVGAEVQSNTVSASVVIPVSTPTSLEIVNPNPTDQQGVTEFVGNTITPGLDASVYTHLSFYVRSLVPIAGDVKVALTDEQSDENQLVVQNYLASGAISSSAFENVKIPLGDFLSPDDVDLFDLRQVTFFAPPSSTIYIDDVTFQSLTYTTKPEFILDSMNTYYTESSWTTMNSLGASISLSTVPGFEDQGLQVFYSFSGGSSSGQYAKTSRTFGFNVREDNANAFRFEYKGTNQNNISNNLELKVVDSNDTTYQFKVLGVAYTGGEWKTLTVPYEDLSYFSGADHALDLTNLKRVEFAISQDENGDQGVQYFHNLQYIRKEDFTQINPSGNLITFLTVDHNPFTPNRDSLLATATFSFGLAEPAKVRLKIYDLAGNTRAELDPGTLGAGTHSLTWDGRGRGGAVVRNGLYIYQLTAEGASTTQRMKNIIGVVR